MPAFEEKYVELGDEINFLIVNMTDVMQETVEATSEFIDSEDCIMSQATGVIDGKTLQKEIDMCYK